MPAKSNLNQPLARTRLHEELVTILQTKIMTGAIVPGEKITPERDLAESLKINRATVREAMRKLESLGLVEIRHGDGVYARNYMESDSLDLIKFAFSMVKGADIIFNVLEVRRIIVPEMAYLSAHRRTKADLDALEQVILNQDIPMVEKDIKLHQIIAWSTNNMVYTIMLNFFNNQWREYNMFYFENERNAESARAFHRDIFEAIKHKKPEEARRTMQDALLYAENAVKDILGVEK